MPNDILPPVPESTLPPLSTKPDTTGENWEDFSRVPLTSTLASGGALAAVVGGLAVRRKWKEAAATLGGGVIAAGYTLGIAAVGARQFLGAPHTMPLTTKEQAFVDICPDDELTEPYRRAKLIGRMITGIAPDTFETYYQALTDFQVATIKEHRAEEAEATWEWMQALPCEVVRTEASDGVTLVGHVMVTDESSSRWAIVVHGYYGAWNEMSHYARHWAQLGYNLLLPEMRAHGESGGNYIGMGWLDRRDLVTWAQWLLRDKGPDLQIVMHGHSMGGASVLLAAAEEDLPSEVVGVVSDCAYSDALNTFAPALRDGFGVPARPALDLMRTAFMAIPGGYDLAKASPELAAPNIRIPVLLFHGERDIFVPPYMAGRIKAALPEGSSRLVMVEGAGHCQSALADPDAYWSEVKAFEEGL